MSEQVSDTLKASFEAIVIEVLLCAVMPSVSNELVCFVVVQEYDVLPHELSAHSLEITQSQLTIQEQSDCVLIHQQFLQDGFVYNSIAFLTQQGKVLIVLGHLGHLQLPQSSSSALLRPSKQLCPSTTQQIGEVRLTCDSVLALLHQLTHQSHFSLQLTQSSPRFAYPASEGGHPAEPAGLVVLKGGDECAHEVVDALCECSCLIGPCFWCFCDLPEFTYGELRIGRVRVETVRWFGSRSSSVDADIWILLLEETHNLCLELSIYTHSIIFYYSLYQGQQIVHINKRPTHTQQLLYYIMLNISQKVSREIRIIVPIFKFKILMMQGERSVGQEKVCNCRNSKCMKLYCQCFSAGLECNRNCKCIDCRNQKGSDFARMYTGIAAGTATKAPKLDLSKDGKGCSCRKSFCVKKYCECFQEGVLCTDACKCIECQNNESMANKTVLNHLKKSSSTQHHKRNSALYPIVLSRNTDTVYNILDGDNLLSLDERDLQQDVAGLFRVAVRPEKENVMESFIRILKALDNKVSRNQSEASDSRMKEEEP